MAENTSTFTGAAADGTALTAVYLTQPAANVAIGLVFAGSDLPHIVHWGRPLAKPDTLLAAYDALKPQRVSGALDDTAWPSILPTQAESWIGEQRVVLRRAGVELFPKFTVTNIETGGVLEATLDAVSGESYTDVAGHARATGRLPLQGRTQQVLDLTNPDAFDYIYGCMDQLVGELGIDYIKWDHNKLVTEPGSRRSGRPAVHAQTLAVYNIFKGLKTAHPGLEIESCSSGGGRVDLGILEHADRIWVSDCVDPVERADIQRYTSLLVPPAMMGEHVGASPAHSTQRATSQELRMAMAFFGHMGIEWNLLKEPDEALAKLAVWVAEFKKHRDWFAIDTCVHADSNDPAVRLDGMVMPNRDAAIYRFTQLTTSQTYPAAPVHLPGLDPERTYRVSPLDPSLDLTGLTNGQSTLGWWNEEGVVLTGEALQRYGIRPPSLHPQQAVLLKAVALS